MRARRRVSVERSTCAADLAAMGRLAVKDIARAPNLPDLITSLVKKANYGDAEAKEYAAEALKTLATQNHGEQTKALFEAGAIAPLVKILTGGSAKAQACASGALCSMCRGKPVHQTAVVEAGAIAALIKLLKTGSAKNQEEVPAACIAPVASSMLRFR